MARFAQPLIGLGLAIALGSAALAAQPVSLKSETVAQGRITLGDLFDGAGRAAGVVVAPAPNPGGTMVLDASLVQRAAMSNGLSWANEQGIRRIIVRGGAPAETAAAPVRGQSKGVEVLTWTRSLDAGEMITAEDLSWSLLAAQPAGSPRDADALIGKVAKRPLRSGAAASMRDVGAAQVIKKDDMVTVTYDVGGVSLSLQAKAMGPASVGDSLSLTNPQSKKIIQAVASGPGHAIVGPDAAALRADARSYSSNFAIR